MKRIFHLIFLLCTALCGAFLAQSRAAVVGHFAPKAAQQMLHTDSILPEDSVEIDTLDAIESPEDAVKPLSERLLKLLDNEIFDRTQVGMYVYDLTADSLIFAYHERQCMRPASNEKIMTAITALSTLGADHTYRTTLSIYPEPTDTDSVYTGQVCIRAAYDPLFGADDMRAFARSLKEHGITRISSPIVLDLSMKNADRLGWGWCWDDDEVPTTPLLYNNKDTFTENLRRTFRTEGIEWDGMVSEAHVPTSATNICTRTHTIADVLTPMMKKSNNSMAESMFYQLAAHEGKQGAGRKQALVSYNRLIRTVGLDPSHYQIADGSGLSLYNYLTPQLLAYVLRYAYAHPDIYNPLRESMPIAGRDGTLRKRMRGTKAAGNVHAKTGTVEGVSTLSGYCTAANGNTLCFSIMNQGIRHTSTGRNFQDRVCRELCK